MELNNKKSKLFWLIPMILFVIILILLSFCISFGKIEEPNYIPTGNVDVFDIDISCDCDKNSISGTDKTEKCITTDRYGNEISIPEYSSGNYDYNDPEGKVYVDDKDGNYIYHKNLRIFDNAAFKYKNKIAPGTSNTYNFTVHNSSRMNLKYYIEMKEKTSYKINLKYRLKRNDSYIIGNKNTWVNASQLKTEFNKLNSKTSDKYSLDWKWKYEDGKDNQDTNVGENMNDIYKLNIEIYFEQVV